MTTAEARDSELLQSLVERTVYTPLRRGSAVAETVARLGQAIGMGLLRPGDRLPPEARLAEELGISPVTLRNALTILRGAGLLETQRGRVGGTFVAEAAASRRPPGVEPPPNRGELRDLADERAVVEGGAAALAAERATPEQLDELARLTREMEAADDYERWSAADALFHLVVADASGSPRLTARVAELRREVYGVSRHLPTPAEALELANREHRDLVRALRAGKPERARAVMAGHVESTYALWQGLGLA